MSGGQQGDFPMPHTRQEIHGHFQNVASKPDAMSKKSTLFDTIYGMQARAVSEAKALGATDAMLKPFTDDMATLLADKAHLVSIDLS
jgi:hypothetical protein